jgi:PAS domain S-box-containing protein
MSDCDGRVASWNTGAARLTGYRAEEIIGQHVSVFYPGEDILRDHTAQEIRIATAEGRFEAEGWRVRKDGTRFWGNLVVTAVHDGAGKLKGFSRVTRDLTIHKLAEKEICALHANLERRVQQRTAELAEVNAWQRGILDSANLSIISTGPDGIIRSFNRAAERLLGYTAEELVGKGTPIIIHDAQEVARRAEELSQELGTLVEPGFEVFVAKAGHGITDEREWTYIRKDGSRFPVRLSVTAVRDDKGNLSGFLGIAKDITERRQAEEALRKSEARNGAILESALDGIITIDHEGKVMDFNSAAEKIFGCRREDIIAKPAADLLILPSLREKQFVVTGEGSVLGKRIEIPAMRADGTEFPIELSLLRVGIEDPPIFTGFVRDLTRRKRAEKQIKALNEELKHQAAQLLATNKELEAFSYSVSHDLRAPLRSIDGFSQALLEDYAGKLDEQGKDYLQRVRVSSQRMAELIDDLLSLSRVTRSELHIKKVNLSATARAIAAELQQSEPERRAEFVIADGLVADADEGLMRVVLANLLGNAWKFTAKHPQATIQFGITQQNGATAYFVRDDGAGFDMAYAHKLFGAFQRLHGHNEFPGTGIGLATVRRVINRHGGDVWTESKLNQGTTFYFTLLNWGGAS